jgi:hypothetical protein
MYVIEIRLRGEQISSAFMTKLQDVQKFAMDWSKHKHTFLGFRVPFNDFNIFVYDVSKPCPSHHIEKPTFIYY